MPIVISSKGNDFSAWRAAENFGATFREALLKRAATLTSEQAGELFLDVGQVLERSALEHEADLLRIRRMVHEVATVDESTRLGEIVQEFYGASYALFGRNRSAPAFYGLGEEFLMALGGTVIAVAGKKLGPLSRRLPPLALIALGPAGRREFSPFCRLQLLLLHGEIDPSYGELLGLLGRALHETFEAAGLQPDEVVTPRNPDWRGTPAQWRQRLARGLEGGQADGLIDLLRLADQSPLHDQGNLGADFRGACLEQLAGNKTAMQSLVTRLNSLSKGLGLMGGIRLERSGPFRGLFRLLDHALLPLSAGITALSLMCGIDARESTRRIRELQGHGWLDVEMAERLLEAWHLFNMLRLTRETEKHPDWGNQEAFYLGTAALSETGQDEIRECLETVAALQRHVGITFSGWEERTAC